jgi:hypothetical protein
VSTIAIRRQLAPGIYEDAEGTVHVDVPEVLAVLGWEDTPQNREDCSQIWRGLIRSQAPDCRVTVVE